MEREPAPLPDWIAVVLDRRVLPGDYGPRTLAVGESYIADRLELVTSPVRPELRRPV
ncbi:hypothetical protein [Streptomyces sp. NPDC058665]|uniref:hypothetical protein n=1 Tax=Streptomyces sp. NPDC058665 TaxID=3346586 RepID=UPI00364E005E